MTTPIVRLVERLKKNPVFKFVSSVRLAVPLMLTLATVVATGTIYESLYNTDVARILVYRTWWFEVIMLVLWLNIFCAASRIPYKKHHTGFVITHIGLLTLLIGAQMTSSFGLDGQLRVIEGQSGRTVVLDELVVKAMPKGSGTVYTYPVKRRLDTATGSALGLTSLRDQTGILAENYLPFVNEDQGYVSGPAGAGAPGVAVTFSLQSAFFNVSESLHSIDKPEMQMGPAHLKIFTDRGLAPARAHSTLPHAAPAPRITPAKGPVLLIKDAKSGEVLERVAVADLVRRARTVKGVQVAVAHAYAHATVAGNKLAEDPQAKPNPAVELRLEHAGQSSREIVFAKYPTFSLNPNGPFGLRFEVQDAAAGEPASPAQEEASGAMPQDATHAGMAGGGPMMGAGNTIEFHVSETDSASLKVVLLRAGKQVLEQTVTPGQTVQTPWMGIKLTINSIIPNGVLTTRVKPTEMRSRMPLPPSAILVRSDSSGTDGVWLAEGDVQTLTTSRGTFEVYYGRDTVELPFTVHLEQFRKTDYPGTDTPMSFESTVTVNQSGSPVVVRMNEPYQYEGHLMYQSSYEMGQGQPTASIFSVNRDPGRWVKYIGAIILVFGIAIFTIMRSKWYLNRGKKRGAAKAASVTASLVFCLFLAASGLLATSVRADAKRTYSAFTPDAAQGEFTAFASRIETSEIEALPTQSRGRVKPLDSLARENILFLTGKSSMWGLNPVQLFLALSVSPASPYLELVNIRDPDLRVTLGFQKSQRWFTFQQLQSSKLEELARPLAAKQEENEKSLTADDKKVLEAMQQLWLLRELMAGGILRGAMVLDPASASSSSHGEQVQLLAEKANRYLGALENEDFATASMAAAELVSVSRAQPMPELFRPSLDKMGTEVFYNHSRIFFCVAVLYLLLGVTMVSGLVKQKLTRKVVLGLLATPFALHAAGFAIRVYITGFAPVTNMYGTMVWMALGVVLFGGVLFALYNDVMVFGLLLIGSSATLLLTESIPLVLSPDMDPIVAVLRNNFWLTIHVLTISISYAAFTISMLIGNASLVQRLLRKDTAEQTRRLAHLAYRAMQLGVFLLTAGIILGGWWADYSWGRFWGWDPKETWALIADLGFLAILHSRYIGWLDAAGVLAAAPMAYLLVIMAWYGVNFILAAGLHSYGFSSGGATMVAVFVGLQLALLATVVITKATRMRKAAA